MPGPRADDRRPASRRRWSRSARAAAAVPRRRAARRPPGRDPRDPRRGRRPVPVGARPARDPAAHGARVDEATQVVRFPPDLVRRALAGAPRTFTMAAALPLRPAPRTASAYFTTDGCGVGDDRLRHRGRPRVPHDRRRRDGPDRRRPARDRLLVADRQRPGPPGDGPAPRDRRVVSTTPSSTSRPTVMGARLARHAVEMATRPGRAPRRSASAAAAVRPDLLDRAAGPRRRRPRGGAGLRRGRPAGGDPVDGELRSTGPATIAGALVAATPRSSPGLVLVQLVHPGAPVFHSIMPGVMDPRTGGYLTTSLAGEVGLRGRRRDGPRLGRADAGRRVRDGRPGTRRLAGRG